MLNLRHRLAAILAADAVGYSRLMEAAEYQTHVSFMRMRSDVFDPGVAKSCGQIVKNTGDGFLAIFEDVDDAVECALSLQAQVETLTSEQPRDLRIRFRMAVHQSEIIVENDDVYGDGVNIASRLQAYAEPGGVVISNPTDRQFASVEAIDLGELHLRNLARPVRAFALSPPGAERQLIGDVRGGEARPSIAVLPFRSLEPDNNDSYFADGIVDEIIHTLAALKDLFVVSRGSALAHGRGAVDIRAVGRDLGVRYVLAGSLRRSRGRLRIITELSDTATGAIIGSEQYDGMSSDLFQLQDQISAHVVNTIAPQVREQELKRALRTHPQSLTAYDLVLQALDLLYRMDLESFSRARSLLQQAISHDPQYAPAHTYAAYWYILRVGEIGSADPEQDAVAAARYAAQAIERNAYDALALAIYGHVQSYMFKNYGKARQYLDRAIAAGPNLAIAWTMSSATSGFVGDGAAAVAHAEQGVRLSPLDAHTFWHEGILAQAHYVNGDDEQALLWARRAVGRNDRIRFTTRTLIASLASLGRSAEAAEAARQLLALQPDFKLGPYAERCPFTSPVLDKWIAGLRSSGLPE